MILLAPLSITQRKPGCILSFLCLGMFLTGCAAPSPPPDVYVLSPTRTETIGAKSQAGLPVIEVRPVVVPDYLDTTDIITRRGHQVIASSTARWGERLSLGFTRSLTSNLAAQIPGMATTTSPSIEPPEYQLLISAETFEAQPDSNVRLAARWNILDGKTRKNLAAERTTIEEMVEASGDAGLVEAMNRAVTRLAQQIAEQIKSLNRHRLIRSGKNS